MYRRCADLSVDCVLAWGPSRAKAEEETWIAVDWIACVDGEGADVFISEVKRAGGEGLIAIMGVSRETHVVLASRGLERWPIS